MGSSPHFPHERFYCIPTVTHRKSDDITEENERLIEAADVEAQTLREGRLRAQVILGRARRAASRLQEKTNMAVPAQRVADGTVVEADKMDDGALSPKVTVPAIAQAVLGVILVLLAVIPGLIKDESTQNTLLTLGLALLGASGVTGALGFSSRPGKVVVARTVR